jgi:predicted adenylyl cyclase CyaB
MHEPSERPRAPSSQPVETEGKWRLRDERHAENLRRRLVELGATAAGLDREHNQLLDHQGQLEQSESVLRVRSYDGRDTAMLTWKGARQPGPYKQRVELEVEVSNGTMLLDLLNALGFTPSISYGKERETWIVGEVVVALDKLLFGWFCEIEGTGAQIASTARELDLADADIEQRGYPSLMAEFRRSS